MGKKKNQVSVKENVPAVLAKGFQIWLDKHPGGSAEEFLKQRQDVLKKHKEKGVITRFTRTPDGVVQNAHLISETDASEINWEQSKHIT